MDSRKENSRKCPWTNPIGNARAQTESRLATTSLSLQHKYHILRNRAPWWRFCREKKIINNGSRTWRVDCYAHVHQDDFTLRRKIITQVWPSCLIQKKSDDLSPCAWNYFLLFFLFSTLTTVPTNVPVHSWTYMYWRLSSYGAHALVIETTEKARTSKERKVWAAGGHVVLSNVFVTCSQHCALHDTRFWPNLALNLG